MKVYQCVHKYPPHIPLFEAKHRITDNSNLTFSELQRMIIEDGYAASYILHPALEHRSDEVFFTIWNYDRMQLLWAKENGINTTDLKKIKLAQIEQFNPDVVYNLSAFCDNNFIKDLLLIKKKMKFVCWNGIIESKPKTFPDYDCHLTLHQPYVDYWRKTGLVAFELQPAIPKKWLSISKESVRSTDVLSYGQYFPFMFSKRNKIIKDLIQFSSESNFKMDIHLQISFPERIFNIPGSSLIFLFHKLKAKYYKDNSLPPIYGDDLYKKIAHSKIVVNGYTDNNKDYKSNMRLFESIGLGSFLISEEGKYPEGFEPGKDFYTYHDKKSLRQQIEKVLSDWPYHESMAKNTQSKIAQIYSKENQWLLFQEHISKL